MRVPGRVMNTVAGLQLLDDGRRLALLRAGGVTIGDGTIVKFGSTFIGAANITIGEQCFIGAQSFVEAGFESISIGDRVYIAHRANLLTATHAIGGRDQRAALPQVRRPVAIGAGCWLGTDVTVLPGVTIGEGCVVAAGAVVASDCAPDGLYAGVPARRRRDL
jgi:acetyltransferase-like isoleucine patch superfamily enzyme